MMGKSQSYDRNDDEKTGVKNQGKDDNFKKVVIRFFADIEQVTHSNDQ